MWEGCSCRRCDLPFFARTHCDDLLDIVLTITCQDRYACDVKDVNADFLTIMAALVKTGICSKAKYALSCACTNQSLICACRMLYVEHGQDKGAADIVGKVVPRVLMIITDLQACVKRFDRSACLGTSREWYVWRGAQACRVNPIVRYRQYGCTCCGSAQICRRLRARSEVKMMIVITLCHVCSECDRVQRTSGAQRSSTRTQLRGWRHYSRLRLWTTRASRCWGSSGVSRARRRCSRSFKTASRSGTPSAQGVTSGRRSRYCPQL